MAAYDYTNTGRSTFTRHGLLVAAIGRLDREIVIGSVSSDDDGVVEVGTAAMLNDEVVFVVAVNGSNVTVERGCADTIPQEHSAGSEIWFIDTTVGNNSRTYSAGSQIGVKLLPYTQSGVAVPITHADPIAVTFNWRHARPYPPGRFRCNDEPWFTRTFVMEEAQNELTFTWRHRDRLLQSDQMIPHIAGNIGPEPGTTYIARVYDSGDVLRRTVTGITGNTWLYTRTMAEQDFLIEPTGRVEFYSIRDDLTSLQGYTTLIEVEGLTFGEDESEFNFRTAGYVAPTSDTIFNFQNAGYIPPTSQ